MASLTVLFRFLYVGFVRNRQGRLTEWSPAFDKGRSELCYNKLVCIQYVSLVHASAASFEHGNYSTINC